MPSYLCECRLKTCRRSFDLAHATYSQLRAMGAVLSPECAEREDRYVVYVEKGKAVAALSIGPRMRPPSHPSRSAIKPT